MFGKTPNPTFPKTTMHTVFFATALIIAAAPTQKNSLKSPELRTVENMITAFTPDLPDTKRKNHKPRIYTVKNLTEKFGDPGTTVRSFLAACNSTKYQTRRFTCSDGNLLVDFTIAGRKGGTLQLKVFKII